jgi:hypothetical protein
MLPNAKTAGAEASWDDPPSIITLHQATTVRNRRNAAASLEGRGQPKSCWEARTPTTFLQNRCRQFRRASLLTNYDSAAFKTNAVELAIEADAAGIGFDDVADALGRQAAIPDLAAIADGAEDRLSSDPVASSHRLRGLTAARTTAMMAITWPRRY